MAIRLHFIIPIAALVLCMTGCGRQEKTYPEKAPVPVTVMQLEESTPLSRRLYAGSVRSWKIEDISFEVDGRVRWVVEPGTEIEGRTYQGDDTQASPGTQIAQLDDQQFATALETAISSVKIERLRHESLQVQVAESLPAEIASATAQYDLALTELRRNERLVQQNAGAGKNLDKAKATFNSAKSTLDGLNASLLQAQAEVKSAEAAVEQALQAQTNAERDLERTRLYSAFSGQVADVHVVPGSLAGPGTKVATVQMTNPIKVELEVSAEKSRELLKGRTLMLNITTATGEQKTVEANIYNIAPSADNATRTFTVTLLVVNQKVKAPIPEGLEKASIAYTSSLWRFGLGFLPPAPSGVYYMPDTAIHKDSNGTYVWRVTNISVGESVSRVLKVAKLYVKTGDVRVPFLGQAHFHTVEVLPEQECDPASTLFATDLKVDGKRTSDWDGGIMVLGGSQSWLLRPGDLVRVDLSEQSVTPGIYVPVSAIAEEAGRSFVFAVEDETVKKIEVNVSNVVGPSLHRIDAVDESIKLLGANIVVQGVHYLIDGQIVAVVGSEG